MKINKTAVINAINSNKCHYLGIIDGEEGEFHLMTLGRLVFSGSPTNSCFLVDWDKFETFEDWEDPAQAWSESHLA